MKQAITLILLTVVVSAAAQNERKVIRQGMKEYEAGNFSEAEVQFRKATDMNQQSFEAEYNTGAALYGQEKYEETMKQFETLVDRAQNSETTAHVWHNMGNSLLEAQQYAPAIEAYKNSLRLNPSDMDTKYNLAYAKKKLQEQQEQQQQQQNQDQEQQDQDQQNQEQNNDQQEQDQQEQEQNQDQQEQEQQQNQDQQEQEQEQNQDEQEQQQQPMEISKEDAERLLNAIQQQEKEVKEKVDKKKAAAAKVKTKKDW